MTNFNNTKLSGVLTTSSLLLILFSSYSHADPAFEVTAGTSFTDNASKTDNASAIEERQDEIGFNVQWERSFEFDAKAAVNYSLKYLHFDKDSSDDEFNLNGNSAIDFILSPNYRVNFSHNIKQLLSDPTVSEINENLDDRSIYGAEFTALYAPTPTQTIFIIPSIQEIDYDDNEDRNSTRIGLSGVWELRLDNTSAFSIRYQTTEIDYDANIPDQDYDQLLFGYNKTHRLFFYNVDLGLNRYSSVGGDTEEPYFAANLTFDGSSHIFKVSASRILTDTSFGNGNIEDQLSSIDGSGTSVQQLKQDQFRASYQFLDLCRTCTLKLDFQFDDEDYTNNSINNLQEIVYAIGVEYEIDSKSLVSGRISLSDVEYSNQPSLDYDRQKATISYRRTVDRDWYWLLSTSYEEKDPSSTSITPYTEWLVGVKVGYQF